MKIFYKMARICEMACSVARGLAHWQCADISTPTGCLRASFVRATFRLTIG